MVVEGAPLAVHMECDSPDFRQLLWYDRRLVPGGTRLDFDRIRPTTLRPFGLMWRGPTQAGQVVELRFGFSLRGVEAGAARTSAPTSAPAQYRFDARRADTAAEWRKHLDTISVDTGNEARRTVFSTALYHSLIKPCFAANESPFWPMDGPFVFDLCTMWDIYRTQLPLITALFPDRAVELANALLNVCEEEGNLPIGYRMAKGADRFSRQGSALAQTFLADLCQLGMSGIDWDWALCHMDTDLRRTYGEEYLLRGVTHPVTHTLDLSFGYHCTARVARHVGDSQLADQFDALATRWVNAFDPETGLLIDSTYYEGGRWNYSFRIQHDMQARIELAGGDDAFLALLDAFFGYGADPVKQVGERPSVDGAGRRLCPQPVRGSQQRARHGGALGLPLPRAAGPDGRGGARGGQQPVRPGPRRAARQRRLRRPQLLVRLGQPRAVPGRRAEPVPDQRPVVRPCPTRSRRSRAGDRHGRASSSRSPTARRSTSSRCASTAVRWSGPGCPLAISIAADSSRSPSARARARGAVTIARRRCPPESAGSGTRPDVSSAPLPAEVTA